MNLPKQLSACATLIAAPFLIGLAAPAGAEGFPASNTLCFEVGSDKDGAFDHLKLVAEPSPQSTDVLAVHGVEKGTDTKGGVQTIYFNELAGTGTVAPSAAPNAKENRLFIGLTGNGSGYKADGSRELWSFQYALDLDPTSFKGTLSGYEEESGSIQDGKGYKKETRKFRLKDVTPLDCSKF